MFELIENYRVLLIKASPDVKYLADIYVQEKIIPIKYDRLFPYCGNIRS
jgi:hypothetical protein